MALTAMSDPITPAQVLAALASISAQDAQSILAAIPSRPRPQGLAGLVVSGIGQMQPVAPVRRPPSPFDY